MELVDIFIKDLESIDKYFDNWKNLSGLEKTYVKVKIYFYKEILKKYDR